MIRLSRDSEALARRLAEVQSVSVEDAIRQALEERARATGVAPQARRPRDMSPEAIAARIACFDAFAQKIESAPVIDPRPVREIVDDLNVL